MIETVYGPPAAQGLHIVHFAKIEHHTRIDMINSDLPLPIWHLRKLLNEEVHVLHTSCAEDCLNPSMMNKTWIYRVDERHGSLRGSKQFSEGVFRHTA